MDKDQKGIIPLLILIGVTFTFIGGIVYWEKSIKEPKKTEDSTPRLLTSPSAKPTIPTTSQPSSTTNTNKKATPNPKATPTNTPNPTSTTSTQQTSTPSPTPQLTPTPVPKVNCQVCTDVTGGVCSSSKSGTAPLIISFVYAASWSNAPSGNNDYVTNVQWDFNGDGSWDTPYDTSQQHPSAYTYSSSGNYTPRMHLQTRDGLESDVCTGSVTVN